MDTSLSQKKRGTYGRPCDFCASRRVRCEIPPGSKVCKKCLAMDLSCTHDRVRLKSGPKNGRRNRKEIKASKKIESSGSPAPKKSRYSLPNNIEHSVPPLLPADVPSSTPMPGHTTPNSHPVLEGIQPVDSRTTMPLQPDPTPMPPQLSPQVFFSPYIPQSQGQKYNTPPFISHASDPRPHLQGPTIHTIPTVPSVPTLSPFPSQTPREDLHIGENPLDAFVVKPSTSEDILLTNSAKINENEENLGEKQFSRGGSGPHAKLSLEHLLSRLQVYQTWFYGYWPILSVAELISVISDGAQLGYEDNFITLTSKNAMSYSLCCAVCAAITTQLSFVSSTNSSLNCNAISADAYAKEAKRVRDLFDYTENPNMNTLLISFFLYAHYVNTPGKTKTATIFLREAISIGQVLNFHTPEFFEGKSRAEVHRWRKIYYTLLVTERYMCFECGIPVILDPCVKFPDLDDEEYPSLIFGFTELVKVFSAPGKSFFGELNEQKTPTPDFTESTDKRKWISAVQSQLHGNRDLPKNVTQSQRLNIILSEAWIRAIAWQITSDNGMLRSSCQTDDCFSYEFPLFNVRSFLQQTRDLPEVAFETNGPGVYVKLIELAKTLTSSIPKLTMGEEDTIYGSPIASKLQDLESLFFLVTKFKNDITVKSAEYQAIGNFIFQSKLKHVPRAINSYARIEELHDDAEEEEEDEEGIVGEVGNLDDSENDPGLLFFQSMNSLKNFGTSPKFGSNISLSAFMHDAMG